MRRSLLVLPVVGLSILAGLAMSGSASGGEGQATLAITKVVDGDGPTGGYVIDYECVANGGKGSGFNGTGSLNFDAAGPDAPETQTVVIDGPTICTVTETDSNGAETVTYSCDFGGFGSPDADFGEGDQQAGCIDDQSGAIGSPNETLTITVTNAFEADVLPDDDTPPPPAVNPDVVTGTPSFTG